TTKGTIGNIGNVSVKLTGTAGGATATGLKNVTFDARVTAGEVAGKPASTVNKLGNISVALTGQDGASVGLDSVNFEGDTIGNTKVTVNRGKATAATAQAAMGVMYRATNTIGTLSFDGDATTDQVSGLQVWAGSKVGALTVHAKTAANGSLVGSDILAGQSLVLTGATAADVTTALAGAALGNVTVSGSLTNTKLVAGAKIGAVTVGGAATGSLIVAGAVLDGDFIFDGDETYQRAASIASVTVKGAFSTTSIVAGVDPGNSIFGDAGDALAAVAGVLADATSQIGAVTLSGVPTDLIAATATTHQYGIEAALLKGIKTGTGVSVTQFPNALFLDAGPQGEDNADVFVRTVT
ncbi:MAG: hypothetical protein JWM88_2669, partial [Verrucomicrobia bacterium]|nr:hypothetical protein [Verrucomicrobiota bacterium]